MSQPCPTKTLGLIANDMGIAESTVKVHRANLMRKMKARSLPELSRMADTLNVRRPQP
jgi:FixJ family two-component response regulator